MLFGIGSSALLLGLLTTASAKEQRRRGTKTRAMKDAQSPRIDRLQSLSRAQFAYDQNRNKLATCIHLQMIERDLRGHGIATRLQSLLHVEAECRVAPGALALQFPSLPPAFYTEYYEPDRHERGEAVAAIFCPGCQSRISVVHPTQGKPDVPWFPGSDHTPS